MGFLKSKKALFILGLFFATCLMLPYVILGTGSIVKYHDQLDGEIIGYILRAKYLFKNVSEYPEMMNGIPVDGLVVPAVLLVPLYRLFSPVTAFMISLWLIRLVAFSGMFLLLSELFEDRHLFLYFIIACIFMVLPFYPVYGFCIPGQPLFLYALFHTRSKKQLPFLFGTAVLYGLGSSLVLVGFSLCFVLGIYLVVCLIRRDKEAALYTFLGLAALTLTYILSNLSLVLQVLGIGESYVSHRAEMVFGSLSFKDAFLTAMGDGVSYTETFAGAVLIMAVIAGAVLLGRLIRPRKADAESLKPFVTRYCVFGGLLLLIACWYALYHGAAITGLKNASDGLLRQVNLDGFVWLMPLCWCVLATASAEIILSFAGSTGSKPILYLSYGLIAVLILAWTGKVLINSNERFNISKIVKGKDNYRELDWNRFFCPDVYEQVRDAIGRPQESYRVVSLGIYPAAASYNGFYTLDGYSNNYELEYKHEFRKIIAPELERDAYCRARFDDWGNRCYLFTQEQVDYFGVQKTEGRHFADLALDMDALKAMGGEYIFSASPIWYHVEKGLELLSGSPFATDSSWYEIYVYKVK